MECQEIIESLDSLWFFSNLTSCNYGKTTQFHHKDTPNPKQLKPRTPILQKQVQSQETEILVQTSSKLSDFVVETELQIEAHGLPKKEGSGREKRNCKPSWKRGGKNHREQRFSKVKELSDSAIYFREHGLNGVDPGLWRKEKTYGFQRFRDPSLIKMPPFSDGMAMKELLRSWAHAVACTVR